jgi:hypothetical protein
MRIAGRWCANEAIFKAICSAVDNVWRIQAHAQVSRLEELSDNFKAIRAARFDHSIRDYFIPLHNDKQNAANLLLAPAAWPMIYRFFSSLEISLL